MSRICSESSLLSGENGLFTVFMPYEITGAIMSNERDSKFIIGSNIMKLRVASGMTQADLAEQLSYSDKTVSKWERGDGLPDITVLIQISDIFDVTLDYLIHEHEKIEYTAVGTIKKAHLKVRAVITCISLLLIWLIATLCFVVVHIAYQSIIYEWLAYIYAIPVTMIAWLVFNSIWFNRRRNYMIISLLMWTFLISIVITFFTLGYNVAITLLLGLPGQAIILLWSCIGPLLKK